MIPAKTQTFFVFPSRVLDKVCFYFVWVDENIKTLIL